MRQLDVYFNGNYVGRLSEKSMDENDHFGLLYWLAGADFIGAVDFRRVE